MNKNEIVLFETADNEVSLQVQMQDETVWLTVNQMAELPGLITMRHIAPKQIAGQSICINGDTGEVLKELTETA